MGSLQEESERIEQIVTARKMKECRAAIPAFLREYGGERESELVFRACDWYRRLGLMTAAYRLLDLREPITRTPRTEWERLRLLWAARLLSLMGAPELAHGFLSRLTAKSSSEHRIVGEVWLAQFEPEKALTHFRQMTISDPTSYTSRLARLNFSDALYGAGQVDEALLVAHEVASSSSEPLLRGIALQAQGEYLARQGQYAAALALLQNAASCFSVEDQSPDKAILLKWKGFVEAKLGRLREGERALDQAFKMLRAAGASPEAWLDVLRLKREAGLLSRSLDQRLASYPGLLPGFKKTLGVFPEGTGGLSSLKASTCWIDLSRDELHQDGGVSLGIPLEFRALAYLKSADEWGIPLVKLKSLLWKDEAHAFLLLENRLSQIFRRLRHEHGYQIEVTASDAMLARSDRSRVVVTGTAETSQRPRFLDSHQTFSRAQLQAYYRLSASHAWSTIRQWLEKGWIEGGSPGRASRYSRAVV